MVWRRLIVGLFALSVAACGSEEEPVVDEGVGEVDQALVGRWRGSFATSDTTFILRSDGTFGVTIEGTPCEYSETEWGVSGTTFRARMFAECDQVRVNWVAPTSDSRLRGTVSWGIVQGVQFTLDKQ